ncbi:peptide/nickel transport system permease protein [Streptosporangium canum]|uniref:Peptide/nickel transport system permease protein n=1 Tax=Streptosporangium canum TaxID=324952 RepID=A0A1I3JIF9_9ACTN|nr:ABC transporter permease [Streptosporangium canum]SFI59946.1 peptide/nickel transport system permease protein [Streptosporangium canum]
MAERLTAARGPAAPPAWRAGQSSASGPSASGPSASGPSASGPSASGPSASGPSPSGFSASRPLSLLLRGAAALAQRAVLLAVLLVAVFAAMEFLPGDAARSSLDRGASAAAVAARRVELGLDQPLWNRLLRWMAGLPTGDLGVTSRGEQVAEVIGRHFPGTLLLGGLAFAVTMVAALALAVVAALRPSSALDRAISGTSTVVAALPEFVVASVLVLLFALWADLLPAVTVTAAGGGPASAAMLVLPVLSLAVPQIGWNARVARAALADECTAPHVEAAVLDGLPPRRVLLRHVLPGSLPTIAAGAATSVGMLLGGAVVVETIFNYPGVGSVLAGAVRDRDTPLVAGVVMVTSVAILAVLLAADLVRGWASVRRP